MLDSGRCARQELVEISRTAQLLAAGSLAVAGLATLRQYLRAYKQPSGCAEAPGSWLGALPRIFKAVRESRVHDELASAHEELGDTVFLQFGLLRYLVTPIVVTRDPRNVEHMLKVNFDNFPKGDIPRAILHELLGGGIFTADGRSWSMQRKTASHMFTASRFKNHIWKVMERNCGKVLALLDSSEGQQIDMFKIMNRFTLDSIGDIGFGTSIGSLEHPESPFLESFDAGQRIMFRRFIFPGWRFLRFFGIGFEKESGHHFKVLRDYSSNVVRDLRTNLDSEAGDSFLGLFMRNNTDGLPTSDAFLTDMVLNFLIAGRDTTAQAMSWCLFLLMQHPDVESKLLQEIHAVCGTEGPTYDQLHRFKYLEAIVNESLRLYPSVPIDLKFSAHSDTLPDGTYVCKGTMVCYSAFAMGRSQQIWGKNACEFRPERWLEMQAPMSPYENPVFHAGPRECLGKRLAMVEMKACLVSMLQKFRFELAMKPEEVMQDTQMTIGMSSGLKCHVRSRSDLSR